MDRNEQSGGFTPDRRQFLGVAGAATLAAVGASQLGTTPKAAATSLTGTSFGTVRQIDAGVLNVGYVEAGPADGTPVILMHGFPYDIHSYVEVAPLLAAAGYRVIVPYFRGYGTTTFRSRTTRRDVDQAAFALDILALMDVLKIDKPILAGYDWGSRTGDIIAALWPHRCRALVSTSGYLITNLAANKLPLPAKSEWAWWYQYYFSTERGELGLTQYRHDLGELIWKFNSPTWNFSDATYDRTAAAFENPDYVSIVIGNYRWRLGLAPAEPRYAGIEKRLQKGPVIGVPTITIDGADDPFTAAGDGSAYRAKFTGPYEHQTLQVGHNVPQEAPQAFADAVIRVDGLKQR
ncbi:alpha/beta fold hydrolase [Kribbella jiaozuonensis]|uniref:Alpha/beta fold hydrolase n=1 Tax=Kribbella jiaozuonensis TaxID=2575441 RepID=A0A4U3LXP3_9ACTN|nr:alpha/beta hydrolase [Kribbella jiaozuonensis]TKK80144.1 alpha/beta fold hydrolase [Kribbella jiaozuonensis]